MIREVEVYKTIGEENRLRIMRILIRADVELCACEIIDILEKPQYTIAKSLKALVKADLITEKRSGRMMYYRINDTTDFNKKIFETVRGIKCASNDIFKDDFIKLKRRLAIRVNGQCVVNCCNRG